MEVATGVAGERSLSGVRATRIVETMRDSVAEVGIADSTFERVAGKAGVSRGLLHYYFGTKERLLVEVVRRDTDERIASLGDAMRAAKTVDDLIIAMSETFEGTLREQRAPRVRRDPPREAGRGRKSSSGTSPRRRSRTCSVPATGSQCSALPTPARRPLDDGGGRGRPLAAVRRLSAARVCAPSHV